MIKNINQDNVYDPKITLCNIHVNARTYCICNCSSNALLASAKKNPSVAKTLINEAISVAGCSEHEHLTLSAGTYLCISM